VVFNYLTKVLCDMVWTAPTWLEAPYFQERILFWTFGLGERRDRSERKLRGNWFNFINSLSVSREEETIREVKWKLKNVKYSTSSNL